MTRLEAARLQVENQKYWFSMYNERIAEPTDDIMSGLGADVPIDPDMEIR